jgi:hypothetical protein
MAIRLPVNEVSTVEVSRTHSSYRSLLNMVISTTFTPFNGPAAIVGPSL